MSEQSAAFRQWMESPCWRDVIDMVSAIKAASIADEDRVPTAELTVQVIAEGRGVRKGLNELMRRIGEAAA